MSREDAEAGSHRSSAFRLKGGWSPHLPSLVTGGEHNDIFASALPKLNHVLVSELQIPAVRDFFSIEHGAVGALKVYQVRLDTANFVTKLIPLLCVTKLDDGVLLADARVLRRQIYHSHLPPDEPAAAQAKVNCVDNVSALEDKHLPLITSGRLPRLGGLVVLERDAGTVGLGDRVRCRSQEARGSVVSLLLGLLGFFAFNEGKRVLLGGQRALVL